MILDPNIASGLFLTTFATQFLELNLKDGLANNLTLTFFDANSLITILLLVIFQETKSSVRNRAREATRQMYMTDQSLV